MMCKTAQTTSALLVAAAMLCMAASAPADEAIAWRELARGMELAFLEAGPVARVGSERVAVLRIDPEYYRFRVLVDTAGDQEYTAGEWREQTGALAVFNAGQYAEDHSYLGLLVRDGKSIGRLATRLEAIFLAEPSDASLPRVRVMDLRYSAFDQVANPYRQAAQSLMLIDRFGHVRVRRSPKVAHRTAVGVDAEGRVLICVTEGGHTVWEFAQFLAGAGLGLREVMLMDGGGESQLDLRVGGFSYEQYGGPSPTPDLPWPRQALPAALAVFPRVAADGPAMAATPNK